MATEQDCDTFYHRNPYLAGKLLTVLRRASGDLSRFTRYRIRTLPRSSASSRPFHNDRIRTIGPTLALVLVVPRTVGAAVVGVVGGIGFLQALNQ